MKYFNNKIWQSQAWDMRQEDYHRFEANLGSIVNCRPVWIMKTICFRTHTHTEIESKQRKPDSNVLTFIPSLYYLYLVNSSKIYVTNL